MEKRQTMKQTRKFGRQSNMKILVFPCEFQRVNSDKETDKKTDKDTNKKRDEETDKETDKETNK